MIVLDASVVIALLDARDAHHERAADLLGATAESLAASALTVAEILVGPARAGRLESARTALAVLGVDSIPLTGEGAPRLAELRAETGLKLPDCCVLLAAETVAAAAVLSFDDRLRRAAGELGFDNPQAT